MHCLSGSRRTAATTSTTVNGRKLHNAQPSGTVENVGDGALTVDARTATTLSSKNLWTTSASMSDDNGAFPRPMSIISIANAVEATFRDAVSSSSLCRPDTWSSLDVDDLAQLYDNEITAIVDRLILARTVRYRRRAFDPWFDDDCRAAKRSVRLFERRAHHAAPSVAAAATASWGDRRRA